MTHSHLIVQAPCLWLLQPSFVHQLIQSPKFPLAVHLSIPKALILRFPIHLHRFHSFHFVLITGLVGIPLGCRAQQSSEMCRLLKLRTAPLELYRDFIKSHLLQSFNVRSKVKKILVDFLTPRYFSYLPLQTLNLNFLFHQAANQTIYLHTRSTCPLHFWQLPKANRYLRHDSSLRP